MLHWYTYLFPLACILLIAMDFAGLPDLKRVSLEFPGKKEKTMGRKDLVILLVITLLYGCVAFIGLGGHTDPESFYRFEYAGSSAVIYAEEPVDLTAVRYYCGVNEGNLTLEISRNGTDFENIATLTHSYSDIFKWVDAELSEAEYSQVTAIRLTADAELYLGEIGLYGSDGELIPADRFSSNVSYRPLLDEQAVADALRSGKLRGAAMDVVCEEPIPATSPLLSAPNCIITPHMAWAPIEARQRILDITENSIRAFLSGRKEKLECCFQ
jgi:hypothetical protein